VAEPGLRQGDDQSDGRDDGQRRHQDEAPVAPPGPDPHTLAGVLIAMNERSFYFAVSAGDPADDAKLTQTLADVWLASIYGSWATPT
jgi:hypothetical protein